MFKYVSMILSDIANKFHGPLTMSNCVISEDENTHVETHILQSLYKAFFQIPFTIGMLNTGIIKFKGLKMDAI